MPGESTFQDLAEDFGYVPQPWNQGFYIDQNWYDVSNGDSMLVATSNDEFYADLINVNQWSRYP